MNVAALLQDPRFRLEQREAPPLENLRSFLSKAPRNLPTTYLRFLKSSDGAAGPVPFGSGEIDIWPLRDVLNRQAEISGLDGYFAFGSDRSGQLFVFDLREADGAPVGLVSRAKNGARSVDVLSGSFSEFLQSLSRMSFGL